MFQFNWKPSREFVHEVRAHHTMIGGYELVAYDLPADRGTPRIVGWELYGPPAGQLLQHAAAESFEQAKLDAERRLLEILAAAKKAPPRAEPR